MKKIFTLLSLVLFFAGCEGDVSYITTSYINQTVGKLESGNPLTECTPEKFGETIYIEDSAAIFFCDETAWMRMTFSYEKDTVVITDSIYVYELDSNCSFKVTENNNYALICAEDTLQLEPKEIVDTTTPTKIPLNTFTDSRDGKKYSTTTIGNKVWMAENLNYADSIHSPQLQGESWCYQNQESYCQKYGRLYTLKAAQNICPTGWHLPKDNEWEELVNTIKVENNLPDWESAIPYLISSEGWSNTESKGDYGFSAYPAGTKKYSSNSFYGINEETHFWSSSGKCLKFMSSNYLNLESQSASYGFSVRCVKD